ncbi:hypothetical protein ACHAXM_006468, partial [Skeletonema potamos]
MIRRWFFPAVGLSPACGFAPAGGFDPAISPFLGVMLRRRLRLFLIRKHGMLGLRRVRLGMRRAEASSGSSGGSSFSSSSCCCCGGGGGGVLISRGWCWWPRLCTISW